MLYSYDIILYLFSRRSASESSHPGVMSFYSNFTSILSRPIFHMGTWSYMNVFGTGDSWRLMAWKWTLDNKKVLCVINYRCVTLNILILTFHSHFDSDQVGNGKVACPDAQPVNGNDNISVTELISGTKKEKTILKRKKNNLIGAVYERSAKQLQSNGIFVIIQPWSMQMLEYV